MAEAGPIRRGWRGHVKGVVPLEGLEPTTRFKSVPLAMQTQDSSNQHLAQARVGRNPRAHPTDL